VSMESEAQKDLELNSEDAESVVGGTKKTAKKSASHKAAGHSLPPIIVHVPTTPVAELGSSDCDPDSSGDASV
jgi:hypothetical protein